MPRYDPRTALLIVDVQNDFADARGALPVRGGAEVVPVANREAERAEAAGAVVIVTQDWHPSRTPHFVTDGGPWPVHCVRDTWGAALHPGLRVPSGALSVHKGVGGEDGYSAFSVRDPASGERSGTGLEQDLRDRGVERVVVVGLATDYCVRETVLDALRAGFATVVVVEGVRAVDVRPGDGERALEDLRAAGAVLEPAS